MTEFFSKLRSGKIKPTMQSELMVEKDLSKYRSLQSDLKETLEDVLKEYPEFRNEIRRILNVLESSVVWFSKKNIWDIFFPLLRRWQENVAFDKAWPM